jgi:mono/diheme cytochrome c family protein
MRAHRLLWPLAAAALVVACGPAHRPPAPPSATSPELDRGRQVFMAQCQRCHPGGGGGLGPSINEKPLPRFLMRLQVRRGLGAMPGFSEQEIPDEDLDRLLDYLVDERRRVRAEGGRSRPG